MSSDAAEPGGTVAVSVVVPSRGRPRELARLLSALRFQTLADFEVIVVGDTDPTGWPAPPGLRYIALDEANVSRGRNIGLLAAAAPLVAFCDDDCVPEFAWLQHLIVPFGNPRVAAAGGFVRNRGGVGFESTIRLFDRYGNDRDEAVADREIRIFPPSPGNCLKTVGTNCAFRRAVVLGLGGFDEAFRYYLDETDLNARLAQAGWSSAAVPLAEVHHQSAGSERRTAHRVPLTLYEIGASHAYYLVKHLPGEDHADALRFLRDDQRRRLQRLFSFGLIEEAAMAALLATLDAGIRDGRQREPVYVQTAPVPPAAAAAPRSIVRGQAVELVSRFFNRRQVRRKAAAAAQRGVPVTVFEIEYSGRPTTVAFRDAGYWVHRIGLFGANAFGRRGPLLSVPSRVATERRRVSAQRCANAALP